MNRELATLIEGFAAASSITGSVARIREAFLLAAPNVNTPDFGKIGSQDLRVLFGLYDDTFFRGLLRESLDGKLTFRVSERLTRSAGMTRFRKTALLGETFTCYEIIVSSHLLFRNFSDGASLIVNGIGCADRLSALQRIFEHELVHLLEFLVWRKSSCRGVRFRHLAWRLFGHAESFHRLETVAHRLYRDKGIVRGEWVRFSYDGRNLTGVVTGVRKRAVVMVPDTEGNYRDRTGRRYRKFYVPAERLEKGGTEER